VAPGRAVIALIAGEEVEEHARLAERPVLAAIAAGEDVAEQLLGFIAIEEVLLVRRALIGIAGRNRDAVDADGSGLVEESGDLVRLGVIEQRAVDVDPEA